MSNTLSQFRKSRFGINPDAEYMSRRKYHRLNPESVFELIEQGYRIPKNTFKRTDQKENV